MKKSDLKSGMLVKNAHHDNIYIVIGDNLVDKTGFLPLSKYDEDLNFQGTNDWSIVEVYETDMWGMGLCIVDKPQYLKSIWKREDELKEGDYAVVKCKHPQNEQVVRLKYSDNIYSDNGYIWQSVELNGKERDVFKPGHLRKATPDEIKDALVKEAEKKGFICGTKFNALKVDGITVNIAGKLQALDSKTTGAKVGSLFGYDEKTDTLANTGWGTVNAIYHKGDWAELVPSIEIDVKINGKHAKLSDISEDTLKTLRSKS